MTIPLPVTHVTIVQKFCKDCKNFKPYGSKCKLFVKRDLVSGKIEEYPASVARDDPKMCGNSAKYFENIFDGEDSY